VNGSDATPAKPRRRRERTRWLLVTPVVGLTLIISGMVWLEASAPEVETSGMFVEGVPPLALEEERACPRRADEDTGAQIRDRFPSGGRVSSTQVFLCPQAFDEQRVTYTGEVVGEVLPRRGGAWAQVNDDRYALEVGPLVGHRGRDGFNTGMAVWLPDGLHEQIGAAGRPGLRGDVILVRGVVFQADPDDGGGITIRAEELEILAEAIEVEDPLHVPQLIVAVILAMVAIASLVWSRRAARRR
jgi:hypothetical protein